MKRISIFAALFAMTVSGCTNQTSPPSLDESAAQDSSAGGHGGTIAVTANNFQEVVLQSDVPVLVDIWAKWCGPCMDIAPVVEELAEDFKGKAVVAKLDFDVTESDPATAELVQRYNIHSIPTLLVFSGGREVDRQVGLAAKKSWPR